MAQFKVLSLLIAATITISSKYCKNISKQDCEIVFVLNDSKMIKLLKADYVLIENQSGYELKILNKQSKLLIEELVKPQIKFCVKGKIVIAEGNPMFSSSVPVGAESFYPLSNNNRIAFSAEDKILISMINKVMRKS